MEILFYSFVDADEISINNVIESYEDLHLVDGVFFALIKGENTVSHPRVFAFDVEDIDEWMPGFDEVETDCIENNWFQSFLARIEKDRKILTNQSDVVVSRHYVDWFVAAISATCCFSPIYHGGVKQLASRYNHGDCIVMDFKNKERMILTKYFLSCGSVRYYAEPNSYAFNFCRDYTDKCNPLPLIEKINTLKIFDFKLCLPEDSAPGKVYSNGDIFFDSIGDKEEEFTIGADENDIYKCPLCGRNVIISAKGEYPCECGAIYIAYEFQCAEDVIRSHKLKKIIPMLHAFEFSLDVLPNSLVLFQYQTNDQICEAIADKIEKSRKLQKEVQDNYQDLIKFGQKMNASLLATIKKYK